MLSSDQNSASALLCPSGRRRRTSSRGNTTDSCLSRLKSAPRGDRKTTTTVRDATFLNFNHMSEFNLHFILLLLLFIVAYVPKTSLIQTFFIKELSPKEKMMKDRRGGNNTEIDYIGINSFFKNLIHRKVRSIRESKQKPMKPEPEVSFNASLLHLFIFDLKGNS